jgi:hypothetical protein
MTARTWTLAAVALALAPGGPLEARRQPPARAQEPAATQAMPFDHTHAQWTRILERHVKGDRFDYEALSLERGPLDEYLLGLRGVQAADYADWTRGQRQAFWINAYNAFAVQLVLSRYPVRSIQLIATPAETPWSREFIPLGHLIGGTEASKISLDTIEHGILMPQLEDARSHVALHRAAESSPPLGRTAFQADGLGRQLDAHVRAWLADRRYNRFQRDERLAQVSELLDWYEGDFVREAGSLQAWLARYAPEDAAAWLAEDEAIVVELLPWSWDLDDIEREER